MNALVEQFLDYVSLERGLAENTRSAYASDIEAFHGFLISKKIRSFNTVTRKHILDFLTAEKNRGMKMSSISRRLVSIKIFFRYLHQESLLGKNVTEVMDSPQLGRILPTTLTHKEVERLLSAPDDKSRYGLRDSAMLEIFYATGIRVSECAALKLDDIHFDSGYLRCLGKGNKVRIVPFGETARQHLERYLSEARPSFSDNPGERHVFLTYRGKKFSRKGIWLLIKKHGANAGIAKTISPHTLRHSFASHLLANGAPLRVIQEMLGHADIATTQVYTHVDQGMLKSVHSQYHPRG
jgi:integrase/recombinase XerD